MKIDLEELATKLQQKANMSVWDGFKFGLGLFLARLSITLLIVSSVVALVLLINFFNELLK